MGRRCRLAALLVAASLVTAVVTLRGGGGGAPGPPPPLPPAPRAVTRSLEELGAGAGALSDHVVMFNRVPKAGSEMLVLLMQWLQGVNGFRHVRLPGGADRRLDRREQGRLVEAVERHVRAQAIPVTFDRHVYFINFTQFGRQSPAFINLVRDPEDKALSRFYYKRVTPRPGGLRPPSAPHQTTRRFKSSTFEECLEAGDEECRLEDGRPYDLTIPYFCGHDLHCMFLNDERALQRAKENVERYYPVVGVLEELNATFAVLERKLPYFFKGVQDMYFNELLQPHKNKNSKRPREISPEARQYLKKKLKMEYEFYDWVRARLLSQYNESS